MDERDQRDVDAQHRAIEKWMQIMGADRAVCEPREDALLICTFYRGLVMRGMILMNGAGELAR